MSCTLASRTLVARVTVAALALLSLDGCAATHSQRYFTQPHRAHAEDAGARLEVRFVRQSVRELVVLARVTNRGSSILTLAPTGTTASWSLAIAGRTLPLAETDRTYWSAWSGTTARDRSPLKVVRDLAPGESLDIEVRWRFEPLLSDHHTPWTLTLANLRHGDAPSAPVTVAFPSPESTWEEPAENNPNRVLRPGQRGYTNVRPWNAPAEDTDALAE